MRRILCRGLQASAIIALLGRHRYAHLKPNGNKWTTEDSLLGKHPYVSCCHDTIDLYHEWPNQYAHTPSVVATDPNTDFRALQSSSAR